jgi:ABC-2 type transport system permease protein/oleandomycin transport system permease protein
VNPVKWFLSDAWVVTLRNLRRLPRQPDIIVYALIQPVLFVVLFRYVFGGAIGQSVPGGDYAQFLMPGIFLQTMLFGSVAATAIGTAEDMKRGLIDRFRSLPMSRSSVLIGRTAADLTTNAVTIIVMVLVGLLVGFSFTGSPLEAAGGLAFLLLTGFSFSWLAALIGLSVRSVEAAQSAGLIWLFPLVFASSAYAPVETMPGWLRAFAENSPITLIIDTMRALFTGASPGSDGWLAIAWLVGVLVLFMPLAVLRYRRVAV